MGNLAGFLIVDKPQGLTSFDVVARLRQILGVKKIGHTGTLDPLATGILVVAVGKATRLLEYLVGWDKEYEAEVKLGMVSDTYDVEGQVEATDFKGEITLEQVEVVLRDFTGEIEQTPPSFSAVKVAGKKAYELARKGEKVDLKPRRVQVYELEILDFTFPILRLRIRVSKGTYIRSLAHDLGQKLGCGAVLQGLKRTAVGRFELGQAQTLDEIEEKGPGWIALEEIMEGFPRLDLTEEEVKKVKVGQSFRLIQAGMIEKSGKTEKLSEPGGKVAAFYQGKLAAILELDAKGLLKPTKVLL